LIWAGAWQIDLQDGWWLKLKKRSREEKFIKISDQLVMSDQSIEQGGLMTGA